MKIFVAADHRGFRLREKIMVYLFDKGADFVDVGDKKFDPKDDFNKYARLAVLELLSSDDRDPRAILVCGGGQGMAMQANRYRGIRAAVIWDSTEAELARNDNDANVLCLPARTLENDDQKWKDIIDTFLLTPFAKAPRYIKRNNELDEV